MWCNDCTNTQDLGVEYNMTERIKAAEVSYLVSACGVHKMAVSNEGVSW